MEHTDWIFNVQEGTNELIVTAGELHTLNPSPWNALGTDNTEWFDDVVKTNGLWGRTSEVHIFQVASLDPYDVHDAESCAWGHAVVGSNNSQLWNTTTTDPDEHGSPVCRDTPTGAAPTALNSGTATWTLYYDPGFPPFVAPTMNAGQHHQALGLWLGVAKEQMPWYGAWVGTLDTSGIPADVLDSGEYTLQTDGELQLVSVYVTPDRADRDAPDLDGSSFVFNDLLLPDLTEDEAAWTYGELPAGPDGTGRDHFEITYDGGAPTWTQLEAYTSWADTQPLDGSALFPDESVGHAADGGGVLGESASNSDVIAIKYVFLAPPYRWVWGANPVIRQYPRDDGRGLSSAPRLYPPTKAGRLAGGYQ